MSNVNLFYSVLPADRLWLPHEIPPKLLIPSKCFVFNFLQELWIQASNTTQSLQNISGGWIAAPPNAANLRSIAPIGDAGVSIVVGSGTGATAIGDWKLVDRIPHGSGANQLSYAAPSFVQPYIVGNTAYAAVRRLVSNLSTLIDVDEIGWYGSNPFSPYISFMLARDVFVPPVVIGPGVTVQFIYTLQITA